MRSRNSRRRRGRGRRTALDETILNLRTAGFLAKRLWRPALYALGERVAPRTRAGRLGRLRQRST